MADVGYFKTVKRDGVIREYIDMGPSFSGNRANETVDRPIPNRIMEKPKEMRFNFLKFFEYVLSRENYSNFFNNLETFLEEFKRGSVDDLKSLTVPEFSFKKKDLEDYIGSNGGVDENFNVMKFLNSKKRTGFLVYAEGDYSLSSKSIKVLSKLDAEKFDYPKLRLFLEFLQS